MGFLDRLRKKKTKNVNNADNIMRKLEDSKNYGQNVENAFQARDWKEVQRLTTEAAEDYPDDANVLYVTAYMSCDFKEVPIEAIREMLDRADNLEPRDPSVTAHLSLEAKFAYIIRKSKEYFVNEDTEDIPNYCEDLGYRIRDSYLAMQYSDDKSRQDRHKINVGNAIKNCFTHPATWLGVAAICPRDDHFDEYDMEIAIQLGYYHSDETGSLTFGDALLYTGDPDPVRQLIGHTSEDLNMYKNRDEMAKKLREALGDEFFKD